MQRIPWRHGKMSMTTPAASSSNTVGSSEASLRRFEAGLR